MPVSDEIRHDDLPALEVVTRWGLVLLAALTVTCALLRVFVTTGAARSLDLTTLYYFGVAGGLLLLKQIKTFSVGELKLELIEKIRQRQKQQEQKLEDIVLILPLLLPPTEIRHLDNLFAGSTSGYRGSHAIRSELRRLASIGLMSRVSGQKVADLKDDMEFDLADYMTLTKLGTKWAQRIREIEMSSRDDRPETAG